MRDVRFPPGSASDTAVDTERDFPCPGILSNRFVCGRVERIAIAVSFNVLDLLRVE